MTTDPQPNAAHDALVSLLLRLTRLLLDQAARNVKPIVDRESANEMPPIGPIR